MMKNEYQQLNAETESSERPGTEVSKRFWSNIWGTGKSCNKNSGWLKELRSEKNEIKHCKQPLKWLLNIQGRFPVGSAQV